MQLPFITVDVFTDRKFGGNPLAVVPDARGLTSAQMHAALRPGYENLGCSVAELAHFPAAAALALAMTSGGVA